jgi:hypothetical protein
MNHLLRHIVLLGIVASLWSCQEVAKQDAANQEPQTSPQAVEDKYLLPTPDSAAFTGTSVCIISGHRKYRYCGYASCMVSDTTWQQLVPAFLRMQGDTNGMRGGLELFESSKNAMDRFISISQIPLEPGVYLPKKSARPQRYSDLTIAYFDTNGGCTDNADYDPDTTKISFIKVLSYDSVSGEIKMRFDLYFKLRDAIKPGYPEYLHFGDGVVFAKALK